MGMTTYGKLASKIYDPLLAKPLSGIRRRVLLEAKRTGAKHIIDLCCGTGNQLKYFITDGSFQRVIGVDLSPNMLDIAKGYGVECHLRDATKTEFKDNEFELSMVSFALHEKPFELARQIIQEAKRITQPGGYFFTVDYVYDGKPAHAENTQLGQLNSSEAANITGNFPAKYLKARRV